MGRNGGEAPPNARTPDARRERLLGRKKRGERANRADFALLLFLHRHCANHSARESH